MPALKYASDGMEYVVYSKLMVTKRTLSLQTEEDEIEFVAMFPEEISNKGN